MGNMLWRQAMRIFSKGTLRDFWQDHPRAEDGLKDWFAIAEAADWSSPHDVKQTIPKGLDFIGDNRIIFDIRNNEFRLIVHVDYLRKLIYVCFVGNHAQYDRIDPETV